MPVVGPFYTFSQLVALWLAEGGSRDTAILAASVAMAESGGGINSYNNNSDGSQDRGLWQINSKHSSSADFFDPVTNARYAVELSNGGTTWEFWCTAWTDGLCGTKGGHYDPTGDSPAGLIYQKNVGFDFGDVRAAKTPVRSHKRTVIVGSDDKPGEAGHLPAAWHAFTLTFAHDVRRATSGANRASKQFRKVVTLHRSRA
jgi:hypothetical protein